MSELAKFKAEQLVKLTELKPKLEKKLYVISASENRITIHIFEDTSRLF